MRTNIFAVACALAPLASAVAWPGFLPNIDAVVVRRQDEQSGTSTPTRTNTQTQETSTTKTTAKGPITTDLNTAGNDETTSGTVKATGTNKSSSKTTATTFNAQDPAGGATMITPAATAGSPIYKIEGDPIELVWNYTSVQGKPTAVDVLVKCSLGPQTITLTQNMTYKNPQSFTWDIAAYDATAVTSALLNEKYTLVVYDANGSPTMTAAAGYLGVYDTFTFGVYHKQEYQDLDSWNCATCNAGNSDLDRRAVGFAVWMSIVTVFSFTWFVGGFGALL